MRRNDSFRHVAWVAALTLGLAGCVSTPPRPHVDYPVTYQIPVGNTQVDASTGGQKLDVVARQQVTAVPGQRLYFQVHSPVEVTMRAYRGDGTAVGDLISEMRGTDFTSSLTPAARDLVFTFGVTEANSSGTVRFTLSDRALAPAVSLSGP